MARLQLNKAQVKTRINTPEFNPSHLFLRGEQGAWYDPSDFSTLFQNSAGTTPVTALGQPVGLVLDKSRWDGRGVVNRLTRTEEFDNSYWSKNTASISSVTVVANQGPDPLGGNTADLLREGNGTPSTLVGGTELTGHWIYASNATDVGVTQCYSIYVSAKERTQVAVGAQWFIGAANGQARIINLLTGSTVATFTRGGNVFVNVVSVQNVGNGIYRIAVTVRSNQYSAAIMVAPANNNTINYSGDGTSGIYIWGAQLEAGSTATAYQANGASVGGPGNHARQTTVAARPTLQARSNLLLRTEEFENAVWTKTGLNAFGSGSVANTAATTDPLGTNTADFIQENTVSSRHFVSTGTLSGILNANYTFSVYLKAAGRTWAVISYSDNIERNTWFDLANGTLGTVGSGVTATITAVGNGWYRCVCSKALGATGFGFNIGIANANGTTSYLGDGTSGLYVWGAQGEYSASATTYQRVTTATDYADIGLPRYLQFDGTDDFLVTAANLNMTATDKLTVAAGVFKTNVIATQMIVELSADLNANNATFFVVASNTTDRGYAVASKGTISASPPAFYAPTTFPDTAVLFATADISGDSIVLRRNAVNATPSTADQGTGNYGNYLFYIGRRGGTSLPLNGRIHQLIVRGALTSGAQLTSTEQFVAQKTGVTL